jgi:membrane associated rhomboid family serine protease
MDTVTQTEIAENIRLPYPEPKRNMATLQKAIAMLHWTLVARNGNAWVFHTPYTQFAAGDVVTISVTQQTLTIHSHPAYEYYQEYEQSNNNGQLLRQAIAHIVEEDEIADRNMHPMHREKWGALVISKSYVITPLIVYANALVFLAMVATGISPLEPTAQSLFAWGGNFRLAVADGQWWRLISYQFLHGGAMHLIMNTFALLFIGMYLEPLMGRLRFSAAYVLTGICAGLLSIAMHSNSVGVGASGAIFGLYGVFLSMLTTNHIQKSVRRTMMRSILFFVVYNLIAGLQGNTDNAAHIGGLLSGLLIGYAFFPGIAKKVNTRKQLTTIALLTAATCLLTAASVYLLR